MSLIGAAGVGVGISSAVVYFEKAYYDKKINELQGYANQLTDHLNILEGYKNEISDFWNDADAETQKHNIDKQITQLNTALARVNDLSNLYEEIIGGWTGALSEVKEEVDEITSLIQSLDGQD